ncbi:MAG: hypothetical protein E7233_08535 [Lachnospiraceae bacterium]|nr:hypothetical protein [Lachnospiraceae bacterium]
MKKVRLVIVVMIVSALIASALSACGGGGQSTDIAGTFEAGGVTYVFAQDGTVSVTENGQTLYGYYTADGKSISMQLDGEDRVMDYTFEGDELSLSKPGSIFGVVYSRTAEAAASIEGWTMPETTTTEPETTQPPATEQVTTEPQTTAEETTTEETTTEETTEEETETPFVDRFINMVSGEVTEGAVVTFGSYEQDNNTSNGAEPIEWVVLKVDGNKALMVSLYALDCQPFNAGGGAVTWEYCSLRNWLNDTFYNTAFDADERNTIQMTYVPAEPNPDYGSDPGYDVEDKVFLLSTNQAYIYFQMNQRKCVPTAFALANGGGYDADYNGSWGWLRTPGSGNDRAACTDSEGKMYYAGVPTGDTATVLRPAVCVRFR